MTQNSVFEFTLVLNGVTENTPDLEDSLYESGCNDALICYGKNGVISLDFAREAKDLRDAVASAIRDVERSTIQARVDHIEDVYLNLKQAAIKAGLTKQAISQYANDRRGPGGFPLPHGDGRYSFYRWYEIAYWLHMQNKISISVVNEAKILEEMNHEIEKSSSSIRESISCHKLHNKH